MKKKPKDYITYNEYKKLEENATSPVNNTQGIEGVDFPLSIKKLRKTRKKK